MSITDVAAGRMIPPATLQPKSFGARRTPRSIVTPEPVDGLGWRLIRLFMAHVQAAALALKPGESWSAKAAVRALFYSEIRGTLLRIVAYLGALGLVAAATAAMLRSSPVAAALEPPPRVEWSAVAKPFPAFALSMPELAEAGFDYSMRRHTSGGGRKDILSWGELGGAGAHLMVEIYRPGAEATPFRDAAQEIAARTEGLTTAASLKPVDGIESKFGPVSLVEFSAGRNSTRQCLGFVQSFTQPLLQIAGWYCNGGPEIIERGMVACALDRLTLLAAASDAKVGELFGRAELKRNFCGQRSLILAATPKHGPGPAAAAMTRLRGRFSSR
jgi:hypothetical protein